MWTRLYNDICITGDQCVHADATNGLVWSAGDCSTLMLDRFLCETAIGKQVYGKVGNLEAHFLPKNYLKSPRHRDVVSNTDVSSFLLTTPCLKAWMVDLNLPFKKWSLIISGGSRISLIGDANPKGGGANLLFWPFPSKTAWFFSLDRRAPLRRIR